MATKPKDHTKTIDTLKRTVGELKKNVNKVTKGHEKIAAAGKAQESSSEDHQAALDHFASQYKMAKMNKEEDKAKEYAASYHKYAAKLDKHYHSKLAEDAAGAQMAGASREKAQLANAKALAKRTNFEKKQTAASTLIPTKEETMNPYKSNDLDEGNNGRLSWKTVHKEPIPGAKYGEHYVVKEPHGHSDAAYIVHHSGKSIKDPSNWGEGSKEGAIKAAKSMAKRAGEKLAAKSSVKEGTDMCNVCGQTPCNCTHVTEAFKVGDIVKPNMGPHANQKHTVIHVHDDGSVNIAPSGLKASQIKYRQGAVKARADQLVKEAYKPSTAERLNQQLKKGGFDADASLARIKAIEAKYKKPEPPKEENKSVKEELKGGPEYTIPRSKHWKQGHASAKRGDIYQNPYGKASARTYEQGQYRQGYMAGKQGVAEDAQQVNELSTEKLMSYLKAVHNDSMKHEADPTKRSAAKRNKSVAGFARAFNKIEARKD